MEQRSLAIDRFRGALVILMVAGDYLSGIRVMPDFLKHAPDIGFTIADTVAPAFVFLIGLNFGPSFARRMQTGGAYRNFALRYTSLIGIGAIISAGSDMIGQPSNWGVLQAIGVAGLITLLVIRLSTWMRFAIGALLLVGYQFVLNTSMLDTVLNSVHGGLFGSFSWAALLILATAVADLWRKGLTPYALCCTALVVVASFSLLIAPVSKHRVSLSFVLITLALSALVFLVLDQLARVVPARPGILCWWGENALALYLVHLLLLGALVSWPPPWWYADAPLWLIALQLAALLSAMTYVAWRLHRRRDRASTRGAEASS